MRISDWSSDVCSSDLIRDYEVGIKADWRLAGMPVRTNLSGFYSKYTNIQRSTFGVSDTGQTYIRSEERRVGTEGASTCRSRWSQFHSKKKNIHVKSVSHT